MGIVFRIIKGGLAAVAERPVTTGAVRKIVMEMILRTALYIAGSGQKPSENSKYGRLVRSVNE